MTLEGILANRWMPKTMAGKINTISAKENRLSTMIRIKGENIVKVALKYALIFALFFVYNCPFV